MRTRISLLVVIIAGLAVTGLSLLQIKPKITGLKSDLQAQTQSRQKAESDLANAQNNLQKATIELSQTRTILETATAEKDAAVAAANEQTQRAQKLAEDLTTVRREREEAQTELAAYQFSRLKPEQVLSAAKEIKSLQEALAIAKAENRLLLTKVKQLEPYDGDYVFLPSGLRGKVLVSDPKWQFVVLDAGEEKGVLKRGELLVNRNGKLVGKVKVSRVQKDHCIANVVPGWELSEILEGDLVIPAYPHS